jgi:hypothetical protein
MPRQENRKQGKTGHAVDVWSGRVISFVNFERLITKHFPTQNTLWELLVLSQSANETKREKVMTVFAFHGD